MYIDTSYFVGAINVPNKNQYANSTRVGNSVSLQRTIDFYESEVMLYALGNTLYAEFVQQFEVNGDVKAGALQKWKDFIEVGQEYTVDGKDYLWKGLRYTEGTVPKSLIADYVYVKFLEEKSAHLGDIGMQTEQAQNAVQYSSIPKIVDIWNLFVKKYQGNLGLASGPATFISGFGTAAGIDYAGSERDYKVSMYQYLLDSKADFPTVNTKLFELKNSFDI